MGSGNARARLRSTGRVPHSMLSRSSSTTACTYGSSRLTRAGVNAFATSRRIRVCSGGSGLIFESWNIWLFRLICAAPGRLRSRLSRSSVSRLRTSANRVTSRASSPLGRITGTSGSSRRSARSFGRSRAAGRWNGEGEGVVLTAGLSAIGTGSPLDGDGGESLSERVIVSAQVTDGNRELEGGEATQQALQRDLQLRSGERSSRADVPPGAKRELLGPGAGDVDVTGARKRGRIIIRAFERCDQAGAGRNGLAGDHSARKRE